MTKQKIVIVASILALILAQIACDETPTVTPGAPTPQASPIPEPPVKEINGTPVPTTQGYESGFGAELWIFTQGLSLAAIYTPTSQWSLVQVGGATAAVNPAGLLLIGATGMVYAVIWAAGGPDAFKAELHNNRVVAVAVPAPQPNIPELTINVVRFTKKDVVAAFEAAGAMFWCDAQNAYIYFNGITKTFRGPCPPDNDEEAWASFLRNMAYGNTAIQLIKIILGDK